MDGGRTQEDDLTFKLAEIIRVSNSYREAKRRGAPPHDLMELEDVLQYHCAVYFDNELNDVPQVRCHQI